MKGRVLFLTQTASVLGGVERWLADLAPGLANRGWDVHLGLADGPMHHVAERYLEAWPALAELPHRLVKASSGMALGRARALDAAIGAIRPDVVVPVTMHEAVAAVVRRRKKGEDVRLVYPVHELEFACFDAVASTVGLLDGVVSVNRLMLDALKELGGLASDRAFHVPHGARASAAVGGRFDARRPVRIGYCGKLQEQQKRAMDIAELACGLRDGGVDFAIDVAGTGACETELRERFEREALGQRATFHGWLNDDVLYGELLPSLDVLFVSSDAETGPLVAWEAMAHGVLVLSSRFRGLTREGLLRDADTALVFPVGAPREAARRLVEGLSNRTELRRIAERGRRLAASSLVVDRAIDAWSAVLEEIVRRPGRTGIAPISDMPIGGFRESVEERVRAFLRRPRISGTWHGEWMRYRLAEVPASVRAEFEHSLEELESRMAPRRDEGWAG